MRAPLLVTIIGTLAMLPSCVLAQGTCDTGTKPCLDHPHENDPNLTGQAVVGAILDVRVKGSSLNKLITVKPDGTFVVPVTSLKQGDKVQVDQTAPDKKTSGEIIVAAAVPNTNPDAGSSVYTLGLVGLNATGSSSSGPSAQYFVEFDLVTPLPWAFKYGCKKMIKILYLKSAGCG